MHERLAESPMSYLENNTRVEYLNTQECADFIRRTPGAVRNLVMRRAIPFRKPGGRLVFLKTELQRWIEAAPGVKFDEM